MAGEGQAKREEIDGRGGKRRGQHCSHTCSPGILIGMGTFVIGTIIISDPSPVISLAAPTLALCTTSFLSPSCIPLRPWIACEVGEKKNILS